jgi:excisionase family DNA binding protein
MDDQGVQGLSLSEAAARAGRSVKTLRRWIQEGKLAAVTVDTPHGPGYRVTVEALDAARRTVTAVAHRQPPETEALTRALTAALTEREAHWLTAITALQQELHAVRSELGELRDAVHRPALPAAPVPSEPAPETERTAPARRAWWRWWGRG